MSTNIASEWDEAARIVRTNLTGAVTVADVAAWRRGLVDVVAAIPDGSTFRLLVNLVHYDPVDIAAHKAMRSVVPVLLAEHGMYPAVLDLFDDEDRLVVTIQRGIRCTACANVHHDAVKMSHYQEHIGKPDQAFLSNIASAESWLASVPRQARSQSGQTEISSVWFRQIAKTRGAWLRAAKYSATSEHI